MSKKTAGTFSSQLGFVLAAAGSAVGVGNIWRFPYLAAKDGGGLFLIIYLILVFTFGYTLLASDIAIGRKTQKNSLRAYRLLHPKWNFLGILTFIVPLIIMTYYAVIGGWILRYVAAYCTNEGAACAEADFFPHFISNPASSAAYSIIFLALTVFIVYKGVESGIERCSKIVMPLLLFIVIAIALYSLTLKRSDSDGTVRSGIQGLFFYIKPDLRQLNPKRFLQILLDAMSQLFFSLSVSMGIMITYGSYVKKDVNLNKSIAQIEWFDTAVALLAGLMIIPAIYVFKGMDGMQSGPSLIFVALPQVFASMGKIGLLVAPAFFIMAAFAALTSCISVLETIVANFMELLHTSRKRTCIGVSAFYFPASVIIALGYSLFYVDIPLPNGSVGQLLDLMDYISNSLLMPFIALLSSILIGSIVGYQWIAEEFCHNGCKMARKHVYAFMIRFVTPVVMCILFLQAVGLFNK